MFMNEPDFDDEFTSSPGFEYGQAFPSPDSKQKNNDASDLPSFRSGGIGTPQNSRARMLAQQRELQLKKRQSNMLSGGMVRSSIDSAASGSPMRQSTDRQFTPAVRQFSAPKTSVKDPSFDASPEKDSEFTRKSRGGGVAGIARASNSRSSAAARGRYSDDEEDSRAIEANRRAEARHKNRDRDYRDNHTTGTSKNSRRAQYDDYDDDDYDLPEDTNRHRNDRGNRDNNRDYDQDRGYNNRDYDRDRGYNNRDQDRDRGYNNRESYGGHDQYGNNNRGNNWDRDNKDNNNTGTASKWTGATGGRDVQQQSTAVSDTRYNTNNTTTETGNTPPSVTKQHTTQHQQQQQQQAVPATMTLVPPDLRDMRSFLTKPLPRNVGVLQCYIRRNKSGTNKLFPIYSLYLKEGDVFLMASKKRPKNKTSNYLISMDQTDLHRTGPNYLGKLRSNFMGTEFQVFDNGVNPKDTEDDNANSNSEVRCELGAVMYAANVLGSRGPRKMQVSMPGLDEDDRIIQMKDTGGAGEVSGDTGNDSILARMKDRNMRDLVYLINKPPRWNEQVGAYVLNFNGRVTMASVKNFQLVDPDEQNAVVLQFGRVGKDEFTMDLQYPISPFQAFAVTLSSFDSKIACD